MTDDDLRARRLIDALDLPAQAAKVLDRPEYRTLACFRRYLERCEDLRCHDPEAGLSAACLAPRLAQTISKRRCGGPLGWCSIQVHALAAAANAQRSVSDFAAAEATCRVASFFFADDADDLARADLVHRLGCLRRDQRQYEEAERCLDFAIRLYRDLRRHHLWGCVLVDRGVLWLCSNEPWKAAGDLFEAMSLIDRQQSPETYYSAAHHLAVAMADDRESNPMEAVYWLRYAQEINEQPETSSSQIRLLWAEGRILEKRGMLSEAEHFLQTVRVRLREHRNLGDYALASLDLAGIYLKQSRPREVRVLAGELFPIFKQLRDDRDAVAGLELFHRAAIAEALSLEALRSIKGILRSRMAPTI